MDNRDMPTEFEIKIISHVPYSEYKYDIAYGRAKRLLGKRRDSIAHKFNDFGLVINKVDNGVQVRILPLNEIDKSNNNT